MTSFTDKNISLNYSNVHLIPNQCIVKSRSECDASIGFLGKKFKLPITPANMPAVINVDISKYLSHNGYFYIMHRFLDNENLIRQCNKENWPIISISVGVQESDKNLIDFIANNNYRVDFITIDIAHSFAESTAEIIRYIKSKILSVKIIAGNISGDKQSIEFLQRAGADCLKIGLSCGKGCSTYSTTGVGSPMFSAALESGTFSDIPVILDGGVREPADIAKAICAFTSVQKVPTYGGYPQWKNPLNIPFIMAGSIFSACIDSPGETIHKHIHVNNEYRWDKNLNNYIPVLKTKSYKKYYGSASEENKSKTGQEIKNIEGVSVELECNGLKYTEYLEKLKQAIQSQISYSGGKKLESLKNFKWGIIK